MLVVDDQVPFRQVAKTVIGLAAGFAVVGEAESGENAVACAADLHPDLVLMDINLPGINGIEATRRITATQPGTVVVLLSTYSAADLPDDATSCGATAYVHKEDFGPGALRTLWDQRDRQEFGLAG